MRTVNLGAERVLDVPNGSATLCPRPSGIIHLDEDICTGFALWYSRILLELALPSPQNGVRIG